MRTIERKVYSCEFCKYYRLTKASVQRHEERCTNNPNRICGMCGRHGVFDYSLERHVEVWISDEGEKSGEEVTVKLEDIQKAVAEDCPVCMLAYLRQNKLHSGGSSWDYKAAVFQHWKEKQDEADSQVSQW